MPMTRPSRNHESRESKIPKRKKVRPKTLLFRKSKDMIETTDEYNSS